MQLYTKVGVNDAQEMQRICRVFAGFDQGYRQEVRLGTPLLVRDNAPAETQKACLGSTGI